MAWWKRKKIFRRKVDLDAQQELEEIREQRRNRFRILVCIDGTDESYEGLRFANEIGNGDDCDIILLHVRRLDQGLSTGGLQMRVARENMLEWGLELPGIQYLKRGRDMLISDTQVSEDWQVFTSHTNLRGDPLGDNKLEYRNDKGKSIVLKLKTAPDTASGILDQYELGPYNLMIMGKPSRWRGEARSLLQSSVVQKVAVLAPCSVLVAREQAGKNGFLIFSDGTERSLDSARRSAVLAHHCGKPLTLMGVASTEEERGIVNANLNVLKLKLQDMGVTTYATVCEVGNPTERILEIGSEFDLISVSDSGKSRLKRFLFGSIAFTVMGESSRSVLNVR